jgi:salicylate hydroxylase
MGRLLVAGGGIGGLAAALALSRKGFEVSLFERASALSEVGAGLQLSPNAARILRELGVEACLDPVLGRPEALVIRSSGGRVILEMPLGDAAERRWGAPSWVAHRGDLLAALADAARAEPNITLTLGARVTACAESDGAISATIVRGDGTHAREDGDILIAADGVHSTLRRQFLGDGPARYTGRCAFRAMIPIDEVPGALRRNATGLWLGPRGHLVHYPLRGGAIVNLVAVAADRRSPEEGWDHAAGREEVLERFADFSEDARALLGVPQTWRRWALFDRAPEQRWPAGRTILLGDAAHPMPPFLAQGASMAIEDAAVLARCLGEADVPRALERYRAARLPRVARVQREAARNAIAFHLPGPFALARDLAMRVIGAEGFAARYDWLYGWRDSQGR